MPHIKDAEKDLVHQTKLVDKEGKLCFLFAEGALKQYNLEPKWASIHKIRRALKNPYHTEWSHEIVKEYANSYDRQDIETAADLAFLEFYRIIGARYEDGMIEQNGNCFNGALIPSLGEGMVVNQHAVLAPHVPDEGLIKDENGTVSIPSTPEIVVPLPVAVEAKKRGRPTGSKNKVAVPNA